jgi:hypothetical protein
VDAIIRLPEGIVPVDSKFPLSGFERILAAQSTEEREREAKSFVRDVKGHVDNVCKYILPDEGTLPFAIMYIPSESVYYEVMVRTNCQEGGVRWPSMPTSVFRLANTFRSPQAVAKGLGGLQVKAARNTGLPGAPAGDFEHIRATPRPLASTSAMPGSLKIDRRVDRSGTGPEAESGCAETPAGCNRPLGGHEPAPTHQP